MSNGGLTMVTMAAEDRDTLLLTVARLLEENRELKGRLSHYWERFGHVRSKRQVAAQIRADVL